MTDEKRIAALYELGAAEADIADLLGYVRNAFKQSPDPWDDDTSPAWDNMWEKIQGLCVRKPQLEMYESAAGLIPIVYPADVADFHTLLREIVYKNKEMPPTENMGAQFLHGKTLRFIILSDKPYSGIPAASLGLDEALWREKSLLIRKMHECSHYYTKRYLGSARNNLHDELIADFCGLFAAFGQYEPAHFIRFFTARAVIYTGDLSAAAAQVVSRLAQLAASGVEAWSKSDEFIRLSEVERIECLAARELLTYV